MREWGGSGGYRSGGLESGGEVGGDAFICFLDILESKLGHFEQRRGGTHGISHDSSPDPDDFSNHSP